MKNQQAGSATNLTSHWPIVDMNDRQSLSSCFIPWCYKMTGKSRFPGAFEHLTTPTFSENVCVPKSNGRMN
ncbi:hypothetical protein [Pseudomonas sp. BNK-44-a]|uniref:hypothetical protein n=1 Tax=Pseudomonas sp. BNK-44-a TaxID=3376178 RepID=UPI0039BF6BFA